MEKLLPPSAEYVQGQIDALRALILGLAQSISREDFRDMSLQRLEMARTALLATTAADDRIQAIDDMETWVRQVTDNT